MLPVLIDRRGRGTRITIGPASRTWRTARGPRWREAERLFTPEEANAELAELRERLPRLREARHALIRSSERITEAVAADGGGVAGSDWFEAQQIVKAEVIYLSERGILLRDPETGLVDFPAESEGRRVFLCWRLGEDDVAWFHEDHSGFSGRKPL